MFIYTWSKADMLVDFDLTPWSKSDIQLFLLKQYIMWFNALFEKEAGALSQLEYRITVKSTVQIMEWYTVRELLILLEKSCRPNQMNHIQYVLHG